MGTRKLTVKEFLQNYVDDDVPVALFVGVGTVGYALQGTLTCRRLLNDNPPELNNTLNHVSAVHFSEENGFTETVTRSVGVFAEES